MDLQTTAQLLGNFGEFFAAVAVIVTLIYLAIQIRQNSVQLRINSFATSTERYAELIANVLDNTEKFRWFRDGLESYRSLEPDLQAQFHIHLFRVINSYRINMVLNEAGVLPDAELQIQKLDIARILKCPGAIEWAGSNKLEPEAQVFWNALLEDIAGLDAVPLNESLSFLRKQHPTT